MLSYRHGFHAGNHADVLKHWLCVAVAEYMGQKGKPYWYVDTHSGAGMYQLNSELSQKTAEFKTGIQALWNADVPESMSSYMDLIKQANQGSLKLYPGSPWFVTQCFNEKDKARLFELHPQDYKILAKNFQKGRAVKVEQTDGYQGLKSILPPPTKRAMVVIDPPYEQASEYKQVEASLKESLKRFAEGVYMVWYPLINRKNKQGSSEAMVERLKQLGAKSHLDVRLWVRGEDEEGGMYGSGLFIINPPWTLAKQLNETLPFLVETMAETDKADFSVNVYEQTVSSEAGSKKKKIKKKQ